MAVDAIAIFDAPIPGMALTKELGSRPWQQPSRFSTVDEAVEYYMERMTTDDFMDQLIDVLEMGVPITSIANTMQLSSVMEGVHNADVGIMITPVLVEMMMFIAESAGVKYTSGLEKPSKEDTISPAKLAKIMQKMKEEVDTEQVKEEAMPEIEETEEEDVKGLMSRRK